MLQLIHDSYFWLSMHKEIEHFVEKCRVCQMSKEKATDAMLYMPLPIPI